jgi:hypothetical protein
MYHFMNAKSFCKKFDNKEIILVTNDFGPFRCFESLSENFLQNKIYFYSQSKELKYYRNNSLSNFLFLNISLIGLFFKVILDRKCEFFILQSSYASLLEKLVFKYKKNVYIFQDCKDDYKFGARAKYVTAFDSIPSDDFQSTDIYVIETFRPRISNNYNVKSLSNILLIIGAKNLLSFNSNIDFLKLLLKFNKDINYSVYYKPHPAEDISIYGADFFPLNGINLTDKLPIEDFWPKLIVSPNSTLSYDISEMVMLPKSFKFKILHSFGSDYDKKYYNLYGENKMISMKSNNYYLHEIEEFFNEQG